MSYTFLQHYWWFIVSLLGALLVFMLFVQGGNSMLFRVGKTETQRRMLVNSTGRKWELTFTTLVTFGGAAFAAFPLFYSTSFGGAYWLWMAILLSFVLQAVSYEFQGKLGNILGARTFQVFLVINGYVGPILLGGAVATFFNGSNFIVSKENLVEGFNPVISSWANASHGLDALLDPWNLALGLAVLFLARLLGLLYFINNIDDDALRGACRGQVAYVTVPFLLFFVAFLVRTLLNAGYGYDAATGEVSLVPFKYFSNFVEMWYLLVALLAGVALVLYGTLRTYLSATYIKGIWPVGIGTVTVVLALLLAAGWNGTAYYPSNADLQASLTIANSCSSEFTLRVMAYVSVLVPFVLGYIVCAWRSIDREKITESEILEDGEAY